jgi:hypothetical protein
MKKVRVLAGIAAVLPPAVAFAPGATAANAAAMHGAGPAVARPNIQAQTCTNGNKTWVHLHTTNHGIVCYGFKGIIAPNLFAKSFCPGNNSGSIHWMSPFGASGAFDFRAGERHLSMGSAHDFVYQLNITGWSGTATC